MFLTLLLLKHHCDVIMSALASQITGVSIVCSTVSLGADQRKLQSSASLAFMRGIYRWAANSPHKGPVTLKMFPSDDVTMIRMFRHIWVIAMAPDILAACIAILSAGMVLTIQDACSPRRRISITWATSLLRKWKIRKYIFAPYRHDNHRSDRISFYWVTDWKKTLCDE